MTDEIFKQQYEGWVKERDMIALEIKESNDLNRLIYKNIDLIIDFCNRIPELYIKSDLENKRTMLRLLIEVHRTGFNPSKTSVRRLQSTELFWLTKVNPTFECKYIQKGCKKRTFLLTKPDISDFYTQLSSDHFCHAELVSASYKLGVFTIFWQDPEINSG